MAIIGGIDMTYMKGTSLMHDACLCIKLYSSFSVLAGLGIDAFIQL